MVRSTVCRYLLFHRAVGLGTCFGAFALVRPFARDEAQRVRWVVAGLNPQTAQRTNVCRSNRPAWAGLSTFPDRFFAEIDSIQARSQRPAFLALLSLDGSAFLAHRRVRFRVVRPRLVQTIVADGALTRLGGTVAQHPVRARFTPLSLRISNLAVSTLITLRRTAMTGVS